VRMAHRTHVPGNRARTGGSPAARRAAPSAADLLALQRVVGNRAARRILARDKGATLEAPEQKPEQAVTPGFRLLIADEGNHGLSENVVKNALPAIEAELQRITKDSPDGLVKAGVDVDYVKTPPERNDEFTHSLGRNTFLIFLTSGKDATHAVEVMWQYIPLDKQQRKDAEQKFKTSLATEGGVDLGLAPHPRRRTSQSIGFVSTEAPLKELKKSGGGAASASAVLADIILHELGHALGHTTSLASIDHDATGIMEDRLVLGSSGSHQMRHYSAASAKIIRDRLEELARKLTPKRP
jgi:hypothetical protein